ncbi:MAG: DUF697 domain-containing protein [Cyclobacteriaceae bacterium]
MIKELKNILMAVGLFMMLAFVMISVGQIAQIYDLAKEVSPLFGEVVLWTLMASFTLLIAIPIYLFVRLPKPLKPGQQIEHKFKEKYLKRLRRNQFLKKEGVKLSSINDLNFGLDRLNIESDRITKQTASAVFLTTAISQNGKLDALTVFITQSRMVWKIAHLYYQRPNLRELIYLYSNVGASVFLASEIEDLDISDQLEPVIKSFLKNSAGKAIPIFGPTANIILDSLLEGSTNAYLTLRVGILAKRYCSALEAVDHRKAKRSAFKEAGSLLGALVMESSGKVIGALVSATKKTGADTLKSGIASLRTAVENLKKKTRIKKQKKVTEQTSPE